jgi:hypothetical protein
MTGAFIGVPPHPAKTANNEHTKTSGDFNTRSQFCAETASLLVHQLPLKDIGPWHALFTVQ